MIDKCEKQLIDRFEFSSGDRDKTNNWLPPAATLKANVRSQRVTYYGFITEGFFGTA